MRAALLRNFHCKLRWKEDLQSEAVVGLFQRAWQQQRQAAVFCDDEDPQVMGSQGEELIRIYMQEVAPQIRPAAVEQKTMRGVIAGVRVQAQFDIRDEKETIVAICTAPETPSSMDPMHRFALTTCSRLAAGASGMVRLDTLIVGRQPQCVSQVWQVDENDVRFNDALYPLTQNAMRRGYYLPNRSSKTCNRHQCPHWRRCEDDFGGVVPA